MSESKLIGGLRHVLVACKGCGVPIWVNARRIPKQGDHGEVCSDCGDAREQPSGGRVDRAFKSDQRYNGGVK